MFSFWQGLPFLKKANNTSLTARFLGSHRRALALDNKTISKQKNFFFGVFNYYFFLYVDHFEIVRRLVMDLETGNTRNLIGYQYINDIVWQFSEFPIVPDPNNFSFQGPETFRARKSDLCLPCLHYSSFNNSENDTMQLSLKEAKLTGLWARSCATIQQVLVLKIKLPSAPKSFLAFLESGPRFPTSWAQISKWLPKKTHRSKWSLISKLTPVFLCVETQASGSTTTLTMLRRHFTINKRTDT